ncbi:MAG: HAD-IA family hydrolase [Rubrivivax sp.]|nr:HAD-IA family hydrolase [Rubrivivax sp.]
MHRAYLFDLDGTLVDSAPDIADALNHTLATLGRPPEDEVRVRGWIGDGARALLHKALRDEALVAAGWPTFEAAYWDGCGRRSRVHDGVPEALAGLRARGARLAVLTNKERRFADKLLAELGLLPAFDALVAGDTLPVKKPHPGVVHHALEVLGAVPHEALLVGDSVTDVRAARAAGIAVHLVRHGYPGGTITGPDAPDAWLDTFVGWPGA